VLAFSCASSVVAYPSYRAIDAVADKASEKTVDAVKEAAADKETYPASKKEEQKHAHTENATEDVDNKDMKKEAYDTHDKDAQEKDTDAQDSKDKKEESKVRDTLIARRVAREIEEKDTTGKVSFEDYINNLPEDEQNQWKDLVVEMEKEQKRIIEKVDEFFKKRPGMIEKMHKQCQEPCRFNMNFELKQTTDRPEEVAKD
jgi:hypothetical protein